jgi:general secretion pathway protein G
MEYKDNRKAFTMIELIFVITVIGILAAVAIPKLAMNRDDAVVTKAKSTISSIRSSLATQKQRRVLAGNFNAIFKLSSASGYNKPIFDAFDGDTDFPVLEYAPTSCEKSTSTGCWRETKTGTKTSPISEYTYVMPTSTTHKAVLELKNNRLNCKSKTDQYCKELTQ